MFTICSYLSQKKTPESLPRSFFLYVRAGCCPPVCLFRSVPHRAGVGVASAAGAAVPLGATHLVIGFLLLVLALLAAATGSAGLGFKLITHVKHPPFKRVHTQYPRFLRLYSSDCHPSHRLHFVLAENNPVLTLFNAPPQYLHCVALRSHFSRTGQPRNASVSMCI